jgi:DNA-directed RNA polymerase subunit RPC12/RpoP
MKSYACYDCGNLNKSIKKKNNNGHYNYGCKACGNGYTIGDIERDSELKLQGCSDWSYRKEFEQLSFA